MQEQINKINYKILFIQFFVFELIYILVLKFNYVEYTELLTHTLIFAFFYILYMIILAKNEVKILNRNNKICYLYIGIFLSVISIFVSEITDIFNLWMLGCLMITVAYGAYIGIISTFVIVFMDGLSNLYVPEEYIFYEALGIILCLLFEFLPETKDIFKNFLSYFYFIIISMSCCISLYLITNKLNYEMLFKEKFYCIMLCTIIMVTITYLFACIFIIKDKPVKEPVIDYRDMLKNDYELLVMLKNELPLIFKHSVVVAEIAKKAAIAINADVILATAGGFYHEIGRIKDKTNYIEKNLEIAREYEFGDVLTNVIMSHNIKVDAPKSKEAAIIYFTDNILNTIYYMRNVRKDTVHTNKQIIESFFNKSMKDEKIYNCGLSLADFGTLREFYINVFDKQEG